MRRRLPPEVPTKSPRARCRAKIEHGWIFYELRVTPHNPGVTITTFAEIGAMNLAIFGDLDAVEEYRKQTEVRAAHEKALPLPATSYRNAPILASAVPNTPAHPSPAKGAFCAPHCR